MRHIKKLLPLFLIAVVLTGCGPKTEVCTVKKGNIASNIKVEMKTSFRGNPSELNITLDQKISDLYDVKNSEFKASDITKKMQKEDEKIFRDELTKSINYYFSIKGVKKDDVKKQTKIDFRYDKKHKKYKISININLQELYKDNDYTVNFKSIKKDMKELFKDAPSKMKCSEE